MTSCDKLEMRHTMDLEQDGKVVTIPQFAGLMALLTVIGLAFYPIALLVIEMKK